MQRDRDEDKESERERQKGDETRRRQKNSFMGIQQKFVVRGREMCEWKEMKKKDCMKPLENKLCFTARYHDAVLANLLDEGIASTVVGDGQTESRAILQDLNKGK